MKHAVIVPVFFACVLAAPALAGEADWAEHNPKFEGSRTRAEVRAEAVRVPSTRSTEPAGSRVAAPLRTVLSREAVTAQAERAVRLGLAPKGESYYPAQ